MSKKDDPILPPEKDDPLFPPGETPSDLEFLPDSNSTAVSVDTESKLTPISKEEIKQVNSDNWSDMTTSQLFDQLEILEQRKMYCKQYNIIIVDQIERGIQQLRQLITTRTDDEVKLL